MEKAPHRRLQRRKQACHDIGANILLLSMHRDRREAKERRRKKRTFLRRSHQKLDVDGGRGDSTKQTLLSLLTREPSLSRASAGRYAGRGEGGCLSKIKKAEESNVVERRERKEESNKALFARRRCGPTAQNSPHFFFFFSVSSICLLVARKLASAPSR
jgi:hypothetical protein